MQELARSTPCGLWQHSATPSHTPIPPKAAMDLQMDLVVEKIVEPLRAVAPAVFEELETLERQRRHQEQQLVAVGEQGVATREEGVATKEEGVATREEGVSVGDGEKEEDEEGSNQEGQAVNQIEEEHHIYQGT